MSQDLALMPLLPATRSTTLGAWHELDEEDMLQADTEPREPTASSPRPFRRESCEKAYAKACSDFGAPYPERALKRLKDAGPGVLSVEEARFWLAVMALPTHERASQAAAVRAALATTAVSALKLDQPLTEQELGDQLCLALYNSDEPIDRTLVRYIRGMSELARLARCLRALLGVEGAARVIFARARFIDVGPLLRELGPCHEARDTLIELAQAHLAEVGFPTINRDYKHYTLPSVLLRAPHNATAIQAAALLTSGEARYIPFADLIPRCIHDMDTSMGVFKRLNVLLDMRQLNILFARHGFACLESVCQLVASGNYKKVRATLLTWFLKIHALELVEPMLEWAQEEATSLVATQWLQREGFNATWGLVRAVGSRGKRRQQAIDQLRALRRAGHGEEIARALEGQGPTAVELTRREVLDEHQEEEEAAARAQVVGEEALPAWAVRAVKLLGESPLSARVEALFAPEEGPRVMLRDAPDAALPVEVMRAVLALCELVHRDETGQEKSAKAAPSRAREARALLEQARATLDVKSSGAWAWAMLERWWAHKTPGEQGWCVWLLGYLGGSAEATLLEPRIHQYREWFTPARDKRHAMAAIACLTLIETRTAWMMLNTLSTKLRNAELRKCAALHVQQIVRARGWSMEEWADRIVPDGGLNEAGTRVFDYGPRQFTLTFRGAFDVEFVDGEGARHAHLPAARKSDDVDRVKEARVDYKVIRSQLDHLVAEQTARFEAAMVSAQRWRVEAWREHILSHPLLRYFARKLLWGVVCEGEIGCERVFLPTEDGSFIGPGYEPVEVAAGERVRLLHPAELSPEERVAWAQVMSDFEIVQPLLQLERPVMARDEARDTALVEQLTAYIAGRPYYMVEGMFKRVLGPAWKARMHDGAADTIFTGVGEWTVALMLSAHGWVEWTWHRQQHVWELARGVVVPDIAPGLYFLRGEGAPSPERRVALEQVPDWLYSEAVMHLTRLVEAPWGARR